MSCVTCLVSLLLTFVIPAKLTYSSLDSAVDSKLWAAYWAFFTFIRGLVYVLPFLECKPFSIAILALSVWLYHDSFKGGLFLRDLITNQLKSIPAASENLNMIAQKIAFLGLFEEAKPFDKVKTN